MKRGFLLAQSAMVSALSLMAFKAKPAEAAAPSTSGCQICVLSCDYNMQTLCDNFCGRPEGGWFLVYTCDETEECHGTNNYWYSRTITCP